MNPENDDMLPEYDFNKLGPAVRGKYYERYKQGTNVVVIDPDLTRAFPNSKAVNDGLRELLKSRNNSVT